MENDSPLMHNDHEMECKGDPLLCHIEKFNLDLEPRPPTSSDGNCWYDAMADQVRLHGLDKPTSHLELRKEVVAAIPFMAEAAAWCSDLFPDTSSFVSFLNKHREPGTWTDDRGIMCQVGPVKTPVYYNCTT